MAYLRFSIIGLLSLLVIAVVAETGKSSTKLPEARQPAIKISTLFPNTEIFGVKLVNGQKTTALLSVINEEITAVNLALVSGYLSSPDSSTNGETYKVVRNLTATQYNLSIPAGETNNVTYGISTILHTQDLKLNLFAVFTTDDGTIYQVPAFSETVSIVEPDASLFDPQLLFLYLVLCGVFGGTLYFIYTTWASTFFPQKARGGKGAERAKRSSGGTKKVDPADQVAAPGADGAAAANGKDYDESWIPAHHINRPEARRVKSGTGSARPKSRGKVE